MLGYQNKILRIDLTDKCTKTEGLNMEWAEKYIGGKGLAIRYLYHELEVGIDPLAPENKMILMTGPLTGTPVPCSGKLAIASKSPATGTILDCSIGGHIALKIKYAGYDAVILEGKLKKPGYILIQDDKVEFNDADSLWGRGAHETEGILAQKYNDSASILSIGPAGENLLGMACINSDYYRQAGRGGIGAVMGSKNLKAIVVMGTGGVKVKDIRSVTSRLIEILREDTLSEGNMGIFEYGTSDVAIACNDGGILPYKNFSDATDVNMQDYIGDVFIEKRVAKKGCGSCGLGCGNFLKMDNVSCEGPEYETISAFGSNMAIHDPIMILKSNKVADDMGMDTISAGDTIAFAMEMTEKGVHDYGIRFGEGEKVPSYLEMMARKEGAAAELGLGVKNLSEKYGGGDFAMEIKGLEFPMYEPRGSWATALSYAVSDRGACHMRSYPPGEEIFAASIPPYTAEGKGQLVYDLTMYNAVKFSAIFCDFWPLSIGRMAEIITLVTGAEFTEDRMNEIALRVTNIARAFNQREGFSRKDDRIPNRIINEVIRSGPAAGQKIPQEAFNKMLDDYYEIMGWDQDGCIPMNTLVLL